MNYRIVKLNDLSGSKATFYSIILEGKSITLFDHFLEENESEYQDELDSIWGRLETIGNKTGARESFFRTNEGVPGDLVCALYDIPNSKLRLYCIRFGSTAIILGGGGRKTVRAWQDDEKLAQEARTIMRISQDIGKRIRNREIQWSLDGMYLIGNVNFSDNEE